MVDYYLEGRKNVQAKILNKQSYMDSNFLAHDRKT